MHMIIFFDFQYIQDFFMLKKNTPLYLVLTLLGMLQHLHPVNTLHQHTSL